ncbi:MAG: helix-turn-helix domain-containing protein [Gammaproteobacteria bacterium]|nr:helix-turn-helix domain-containing protein [Gammaproteobacteria bacterium]
MCKSCRQLSCNERCQIKALMSRGGSMREIARCLGRSPEQIRGPPEAPRRGDGWPGVDLLAVPGGPQGGRRAVPVPQAAGEEAELAAGMPVGATFRGGWTLPSVLRRRKRRAASATGSWTRSSVQYTGEPCFPRWTRPPGTRFWSCWPAGPQHR